MNIEITKELLGEVLGVNIRKINNSILDGNLYYYKTFVKCKSKINIYELEHKCKEWAKSKGFFILSGYDNTETPEAIINHIYSESGCCCDESFEAESEPEAIFKACQWIFNKNRGLK